MGLPSCLLKKVNMGLESSYKQIRYQNLRVFLKESRNLRSTPISCIASLILLEYIKASSTIRPRGTQFPPDFFFFSIRSCLARIDGIIYTGGLARAAGTGFVTRLGSTGGL